VQVMDQGSADAQAAHLGLKLVDGRKAEVGGPLYLSQSRIDVEKEHEELRLGMLGPATVRDGYSARRRRFATAPFRRGLPPGSRIPRERAADRPNRRGRGAPFARRKRVRS